MRFIPKALLKKTYNRGSLRNESGGVRLSVKNRLAPATLCRIDRIALDGQAVDPAAVRVSVDGGEPFALDRLCDRPVDFALGTLLTLMLDRPPLDAGEYEIALEFTAEPFGTLAFELKDSLNTGEQAPDAVPRSAEDDYATDVIQARRRFVREQTGGALEHVSKVSFDPQVCRGNIEHFVGAAQIPLGVAGPLHVRGQHADGAFYVPLATTEGTLVASYNRGMKVIAGSGGVKCAVVGDNMQRAPVFEFEDAATARRFADWLVAHMDDIKAVCTESDRFVTLKHIDYYLVSRFVYTRFNFTTGDAAGMNMVGKATFAACNWILQHAAEFEVCNFFLESNFATDKKASMINSMRTRGKRVVAECTVKRDVLRDVMDADTEMLAHHAQLANIGAMLSGANNNGAHAANAITAIFIATGQDVANVAESSAGILYTELTRDKDLYISITLPSLIVATVGGGTGLPTQNECLQMMDCAGPGKVMKLAEIIAGTVLAGEISLAAAISSLDWVSSHDQYGRNDPTRPGH
ncbi:hydroxymethylglutaryl-CoA reductase [Wenzhouxiangella sp. XN79A]|uniref:hydroxymethylglutaryl-CoA reductase n=1 Tax=Wenzhouxiangella sp. XN79A TaxID=2724193 RepID=UPI00144AC9B8|nr:hydroxymethylglutaryl-CoA reductase [Wenzhouxiangella sp. XN79A]NKI34783.1 hydroxymethylglutaryl-CoA reductase [Wenzhouxiangella sp. XN79A]